MNFNPTSETARQEVLEYAKEHLSIIDAKKILESRGYFTERLWHIVDVMDNYKCDEDMAQEILYKALTNDYVSSVIWRAIDLSAEELNVEYK